MTKAANKTTTVSAKNAIAKEAEKTIEFAEEEIKKTGEKPTDTAVTPKLSELAQLKIDEKATKAKIAKKTQAITGMKQSVKDVISEKENKAKRVDVTAQNAISEKSSKENSQKAGKQNQLQQTLDEKTQKKRIAIKNATAEYAWLTKPCEVDRNGVPMSLAAKESCAKDKEKRLNSMRLKAQEKAQKRKERMDLLEKAAKAEERRTKREQKSKEAARKEKARKEKKEKHERKRKREREKQRKADKRKEQADKEKERKAARKRTREE